MNCLNEKDIINTYKNFGYDVFKIDFDGYKSIIHFKDKNDQYEQKEIYLKFSDILKITQGLIVTQS